MRTWMAAAGAALVAGAALAQSPAQQPAAPRPAAPEAAGAPAAEPPAPVHHRHTPAPPEGFTQLFMSPSGEPWRSGPGDPYPVKAWFDTADTNHDGALDRDEFRADHLWFFDALDQDRNGYLDGTEVSFYEHRVAPDVLLGQLIAAAEPGRGTPKRLWGGEVILAQAGSLGGAASAYQGPSGPAPDLGASRRAKGPPVGAAAYALLNDAEPVSGADADLNGRITRAEFQAAADRRFKRLDRDGDGKLVLAELPRPPAQQLAEEESRRKKR
ncbi:MAG: hypothetical protein ACJ798_10890 [Phenylobacterium sp.]